MDEKDLARIEMSTGLRVLRGDGFDMEYDFIASSGGGMLVAFMFFLFCGLSCFCCVRLRECILSHTNRTFGAIVINPMSDEEKEKEK